jgi:ABC-2 type transport system permease protein
MRNIWLVIKHDLVTTLGKRSFWLLTFLMPGLLLALNAFSMIRGNDISTSTDSEEAEEADAGPFANFPAIGLVDEAGLLVEMPEGFPEDLFISFPDETAARAALDGDQIDQFVHVPADYLTTGNVAVYDKDFRIMESGEDMGVAFSSANEWVLRFLLAYNLTGDEHLVGVLGNPVPGAAAEYHAINPPVETDANDQALAELVSSVVPYIYYFLLLLGSSFLMRSVVAEKENRTVEVLLLSLNPRELMLGKIFAMSLVVVLQLVVWVGGGVLILDRGADLLEVASFDFPPGFFVWATLFLILGYLLFASLMAAAGAIAPNAREGGQMTWLMVLPLMPTLMFGRIFAEEPNHPLGLFLSMFPFSSPSAMVTRLAVGEVPLWQLLVSLAGLAVTTYLFINLAARFFQSGNLLSQASFSWRRLATGWRRTGG